MTGSGRREILAAWYQASRPPFYIATLVPLTLGFVLAGVDTGRWLWGRFILINLASFMVHLASNLANDLFDHVLGADAGPSIGGSRVIQKGLISPTQLAWALVLLFSGAFILAVIIIRSAGRPELWLLVVFAAFSAFFYVAPPVKYGYRGLGEVFVFINMGLIMVGGTYLASAEAWRWDVLLYAAPVGLMVASILYYQSLPDIETDRAAGKRTLAVRLGRPRAIWGFRLGWGATYVWMWALGAAGMAGWIIWFSTLTLPLFLRTDRLIRGCDRWVELDAHGGLVRRMYLVNGVLLIASVVQAA